MSTDSTGRRVSTSQKDRSSLCTFTFADGRQCRTPRHSAHPNLCYFHARKEAQARAADQLGRDLSFYTSRHYLSACNLSSALARVFTAAAQGHIKTKTATALAYTAQILVQTLQLAQHEYIEALGPGGWRNTINSHITDNCDYINAQRSLTPQPSPSSSPQPAPPAPPSSTVSQLAPTHPPAPKPPTATPVTSRPTQPTVVDTKHNPPPQPQPAAAPSAQPPLPAGIGSPSVCAGLPALTEANVPPRSSSSPIMPVPTPRVADPCSGGFTPPSSVSVPSQAVTTPPPQPAAPTPQLPSPSGIGTLGNWNPPPHSGPPRRARRGPERHTNLCPSRIP